jgi:TolA-binding protein
MARILLTLLLLLAAVPASAADGDLIYRPEPSAGAVPSTPEEGILVRTIVIRRGDTLSRLAKRYAGKGYFYPQILLFNRIDNPNLIYAGDTLRVPTNQPSPKTETLPPPSARHSRQEQPERKPADATPAQRQQVVTTAGQQLFVQGMAQFRTGRYRAALALFDRYLREYPDSPHAADATFYRGECYLNLSRR